MKPFRLFKKYERLYCFPNRFGFLGFALFLVMLTTGATYQNNLVFMMAFLYISLALIAILQTARNIRGLELLHIEVQSNFPGQPAQVLVRVKNPSNELKLKVEVRFKFNNQKIRIELSKIDGRSFSEAHGQLQLPAQRGVYKLERIGIYTSYPYSMFTAWKYVKNTCEFFVYPKPIGRDLDLERTQARGHDFSGHKIYEPGDSIAHIDWKAFARGNQRELPVRQFKDSGESEILIDWGTLLPESLDFEARLSQMSRWIVSAESLSHSYNVRLPKYQSGFGNGDDHFQRCMEALTRTT